MRGHRYIPDLKSKIKGCELCKYLAMTAIFQPWIAKKISKAPSVRVIDTWIGHRHNAVPMAGL